MEKITMPNTIGQRLLTSDIYQISDFINDIKNRYIDSNGQTLYLGIFGYMGEVFSNILQNSIVMSAEYANESIASRAKFEKNIIAHALGLGITSIQAQPARMNCLFLIKKRDFVEKGTPFNGGINSPDGRGRTEFILERNVPIYVEDFEFHLDYDIVIRGSRSNNYKEIFTAQYNLHDADSTIGSPKTTFWNNSSIVNNPYLSSPLLINPTAHEKDDLIILSAPMQQVSIDVIEKKILTGNIIENKTMPFSFTDQLCTFRILSTSPLEDGSTITHILTPVYDGLPSGSLNKFCYYSYLDSKTIRIKFDPNSPGYPDVNTVITVEVQTTKGAGGNFTYNTAFDFPYMADERNTPHYPHKEYTNIHINIKPVTDSIGGFDTKSIEDLKKIIPKEANSRGSITSTTDLMNFFNMLSTTSSKMYFYKKEDNILRRIYSAYILMRDASNNIIPTNTIDIDISDVPIEDDIITIDSDSYIILGLNEVEIERPEECTCTEECSCPYCIGDGHMLVPNETAKVLNTSGLSDSDLKDIIQNERFVYTNPYKISIDDNKQISFFFLNNFSLDKFIEFIEINDKSELQFIATTCRWRRDLDQSIPKYPTTNPYVNNIKGVYNLTFNMSQNTTEDILDLPIEEEFEEKILVGCDPYYSIDSRDQQIIPILLLEFKDPRYNQSKRGYIIGDVYAIPKEVPTDPQTYEITFQVSTTDRLDAHKEDEVGNELQLLLKHIALGEIGGQLKPCSPFYDNPIENTTIGLYYNLSASIYVFWDNREAVNNLIDQRNVLEKYLVPEDIDLLKDYTLTNIYNVIDGIQTLLNYTDIIDCTMEISRVAEGVYKKVLKGVPVIKRSYIDSDFSNKDYLIKELEKRRAYINYALTVIENCIGIDFKFFNTFGPTKIFKISDVRTIGDLLENVQISLYFSIKLVSLNDKYIIPEIQKLIRTMIENIEEVIDLHIPNIITEVQTRYREQIVYFEFTGTDANHKNRNRQHITQDLLVMKELAGLNFVPEFLNIAIDAKGDIGIYIDIV